jgi:hypothetical protein
MSTAKPWGVLAEFESAQSIFHACEMVRDAGYRAWDAHTPFPVHGLDGAMGLPKSRLPWIVLIAALTGLATAFALQTWIHLVEYPLVISGKPLWALPAYVPVMFELTVIFSAFAAVIGMLALNGLPRLNHPLFEVARFERASDDRFFISIEATDPKFDATQTAELLRKAGATHVELVG